MSAYGRFLAQPSTTRLLVSMRLEFTAIDADERRRLVDQVAQSHEGVKATLRGAQVGGGYGEIAQGGHHVGVECAVHGAQSEHLSGIHPDEMRGEGSREADVRNLR